MSVVLCSWGVTVDGGTEETLSLAGRLSRARAVALDWLVIGAMADAAPQIAASHGVAHIDRIGGATPGPDALVALIAGYCAAQQPRDH